VDDTGARHGAVNGVCTQIGNDRFAVFTTTKSKSRLNFLRLLGPVGPECRLTRLHAGAWAADGHDGFSASRPGSRTRHHGTPICSPTALGPRMAPWIRSASPVKARCGVV
ncbi:MAG: hypothetical protein E5Y35_01025, partial [Mesorhizobium sp.]